MTVLITADELASALASAHPPVVLDVRWRLNRPDGRPEYLAGHLPGAVYVDLERELTEHGAPEDGRHPLPSIERLQASARAWGLNDGDTVVVYDDLRNLSSARAWWLLKAAGVADVRILDGALRAWVASGRDLEAGEVVPPAGDVVLSYGHLPTVDLDGAAGFPARGALLDARAGERYRGEVEPIDPRAGHIPGAVSAPTAANLGADGRFLPTDALRRRFEALGVRDGEPVAAYCGSGVTAAHEALALVVAGFTPAIYPGSWSQWSNREGAEVATGPNPR
jgi:thiosulfate/3-mercaptopyruvate sulfurtransferase